MAAVPAITVDTAARLSLGEGTGGQAKHDRKKNSIVFFFSSRELHVVKYFFKIVAVVIKK